MIAIYPRVSTGSQVSEGTSLEEQIVLCEKKLLELGFDKSNFKVYKEEGFSGEDIDRPAMNELRQDVTDNLITHIICVHPDRLSRDMTDKLIVCREFEKYGVELLFVDTEYKNTPEGQLFFNMQSAIAQYELALIKKRTVRGREKRVKENKVMPMRIAPYGYNLINGALIINKEETEFVKMIYDWYINENITMRQIGERLYNLGAIPKRGESKNWSASSIRRILTSEIYIGKYYYNKRKTEKVKGKKTASGNPKKTYQIRNRSEWLEIEIPATVDIYTFELAQKQKNKNKKFKSGNIKHEYLLKSLIKCSHCGRIWQSTTYQGKLKNGEIKTYPIYKCMGKIPKKYGEGVEKCTIPQYSIRADVLDNYVWNILKEVITSPKTFADDSKQDNTKLVTTINNTIEILNKQILQKEKEKEKIKTMFKRDVINEDEMFNDISKINKTINDINIEISKYELQLNSQNKNTQTVKQLNILANEIKESNDFSIQKKRNYLEKVIDEIIIDFDKEGNILLTYIGVLGRLNKKLSLELCLQPQKNVNINKGNNNLIYITYQSGFSLNANYQKHGEKELKDNPNLRNLIIS